MAVGAPRQVWNSKTNPADPTKARAFLPRPADINKSRTTITGPSERQPSWLVPGPRHDLPGYQQRPQPTSQGNNRLSTLPQEILHELIQYLDYGSVLHLRQADKILYRAINPQSLPFEAKFSFVLHAERDFEQHRCGNGPRNFGCYTCFRVLPPEKFVENQSAFLQSPPFHPPIALRRFCVDCGIEKGYHAPGDWLLMKTGAECWLCACGILQSVGWMAKCGVCGLNAPFSGRNCVRAAERRGSPRLQ